MGKLTATMVVDLQDRTGRTAQAIIGNLDRLKRAERDYGLARDGMRLTAKDRAMEHLMMERERDAEQRRARINAWMARGVAGVAAAGYVAARAVKEFAGVERQMTRIGITADASAAQTEAAFKSLQTQTKAMAMPLEQGITALDTLVASGLSLEEAMAFLPSVLATAQASGAATEDIANTGMKASSALKIQAKDMQRAFDVMVAGGKAGQFELKDMAQYLPTLANSFATLGYDGEEGLKKLVAILQTIREDTGDASSAATQAQNIFGKIYSNETATAFKKMGIDLRSEMDKARKSGEDTISAFVRLSKEATKGDLSKLPQLFSDQEFRLGMQSLITSPDSLKKFFDVMNSSNVDGTVLRDLGRVLTDTQSSIDKMSESWNKLMNSVGKAAAPTASAAMDAISNDIDYGDAVREALKKRGMSFLQRETWMLKNMPLGAWSHNAETDRAAYEGGLRDPEFLKDRNLRMYEEGKAKTSKGRQNQPVVLPEFEGGDRHLNPRKLPVSDVPTPEKRAYPGADQALAESERRRKMERYLKPPPVTAVPEDPTEIAAKRDLWQRQLGLMPFEGGMHRAGMAAQTAPPPASPSAADNRSVWAQLFGGRDFWLGQAAKPDFDWQKHRQEQFGIETKAAENGPKSVSIEGTPTVTISNPPPRPNVTVSISMPVQIQQSPDPMATANALSQAVKSELNRVQASTQSAGAL